MRIRQIVVASRDLAAARSRLAGLFKLPPPYRDPGVAAFGLDNAVFCLGDQFIEIVSPVQPGTACGRHLERHGDSGYMLILQTGDLERDRQRWAAQGVRRIWNADLPDISASHLHPKDIGCAIVSVDEPRPAASWRWGGPDWQLADGARGAERVRGVHLRAPDAQAMAHRWSAVLGLSAPEPCADGWRIALDGGFVSVSTGAEGLAGFTLALADPAAASNAAAADAQAGAFDALGVRWALQSLDG